MAKKDLNGKDTHDFSPWISWASFQEARLNDPRFREAGVYLLGQFDRAPKGLGNPETPGVVYIGETTKQTLSSRLTQFGWSAFDNRPGHSGGWTFSAQISARGLSKEKLYVSILPVSADSCRHHTYLIKHIERAALWRRIEIFGEPPVCNKG